MWEPSCRATTHHRPRGIVLAAVSSGLPRPAPVRRQSPALSQRNHSLVGWCPGETCRGSSSLWNKLGGGYSTRVMIARHPHPSLLLVVAALAVLPFLWSCTAEPPATPPGSTGAPAP